MRLQRLRAGQARLLSGGARPSGHHGSARVAALAPLKTTLAVDKTYHWCACGHAGLASGRATALCDGSHKHVLGGKFSPVKFKVEVVSVGPAGAATTDDTVDRFLCMCKQTSTPPYCDGSHAKIPKA